MLARSAETGGLGQGGMEEYKDIGAPHVGRAPKRGLDVAWEGLQAARQSQARQRRGPSPDGGAWDTVGEGGSEEKDQGWETAPDTLDAGAVAPRRLGSDRRVLVADDVALNRTLLRSVLARLGFCDVVECADGEEVIEAFRAARDAAVPPLCILMDMSMPNVDGVEAAERIRALEDAEWPWERVPIYAVSTECEAYECRARRAGIDGFVPKPVSVKAICDIIDSICGSTSSTDGWSTWT